MSVPARSRGRREKRAEHSPAARVLLPAQQYIYSESISGLLLVTCAAIALLWANSPWASSYAQMRELPLSVSLGGFSFRETLQHWINDGLMTIFFFAVTLEIKRELLFGELSEKRKAALPVAAAVGGMAVPVAFFLALNAGGEAAQGWAIPMATDIAFSLGVLALLGDRVPASLRLFVLTFAIVDDIGSILVIALFYSSGISAAHLAVAAASLLAIAALVRLGVREPLLLLPFGVVTWAATLGSGVHATIAGVALASLVPARTNGGREDVADRLEESLHPLRAALGRDDEEADVLLGRLDETIRESESPLERLERQTHPWVNFGILPLFALANAGVELSGGVLREAAGAPVALGVIAGLVIGKPLGTLGGAWIAKRIGVATLSQGLSMKHLAGAGLLGGIGFTVSLFIAELSFGGSDLLPMAKIGILTASAVAAAAAGIFLGLVAPRLGSGRAPSAGEE